MTEIATRLQVGIAASAMAVAATLVPMAAQAAPNISMPTAPVTQVLHDLSLVGPGALPQYSWFYYGAQPNPGNTVPPGAVTLWSVDVPVTFWAAIGVPINKEICFAGLGFRIDAYGKL